MIDCKNYKKIINLLVYSHVARDDEIEFRTYDFTKSNEEDGVISDLFRDEVKIFNENNKKLGDGLHDPLEVDIDHLKRMLSTVLNMTRNDKHDEV